MAAVAPTDLTKIIELFTDIGLKIIPFLGAIAFLVFVWGVARFIKSAGNEKEIKDSKNMLIWGVIGLFVLVTIWGIIAFLSSEFGFEGSTTPLIPQIKF
jgi:type VI protein secretion system component VasK